MLHHSIPGMRLSLLKQRQGQLLLPTVTYKAIWQASIFLFTYFNLSSMDHLAIKAKQPGKQTDPNDAKGTFCPYCISLQQNNPWMCKWCIQEDYRNVQQEGPDDSQCLPPTQSHWEWGIPRPLGFVAQSKCLKQWSRSVESCMHRECVALSVLAWAWSRYYWRHCQCLKQRETSMFGMSRLADRDDISIVVVSRRVGNFTWGESIVYVRDIAIARSS